MIKITEEPLNDALKRQIYEGLGRHALQKTGHNEKGAPYAFVARDKKDQLLGVVVVEIFWGSLHIKYVYTVEAFRGQGIAAMLMEQALQYGRDEHCSFAYVETMNFQAPGFYQKLGFQLEYTRFGFAHGTSFLYLKKDLTPQGDE